MALVFELHNNTIIVERNLKRTKTSISQDSASLEINGAKRSLMPTELKSAVLSMLGYPGELLSKGKNPVYRFTVYTPQEEMKAVLYSNAEERLNLLRKVFGIDKYKTIKDNTKICVTDLREQKKELEGKTFDIEQKKQELKKVCESLDFCKQNLLSAKEELANKFGEYFRVSEANAKRIESTTL